MKQFLKCLLILLLSLEGARGTLHAQLQGQVRIDSLLKELPRAKEDTNKVKLLIDLSAGYSSIDPEEGLKYGQVCLDLAAKLDWKNGIATAYNRIGANYFNKSAYSKALECYQKALKLFEELGNKAGIARNTGNIGNIYISQGDYPKAMEYYFKALNLDEELGDKRGIAINTGNIGIIYDNQAGYPKALEYYFKASKIYEELGDKQGIAITTNNIATVYCDGLKNYPKALEYMHKVVTMDEDIGNKRGLAEVTGNIGKVYTYQKNYAIAIDYYEKALKIAEEIDYKHNIADNLENIGSLYLDIIEDAPSGLTAKDPAMVISNDEHITGKYKPTGSIPIGKAALLSGALDYLHRCLTIAANINDPAKMQYCYANLARAYKLKGDYKKAMEYADDSRVIKDSVFSKENSYKIVKMENDRKQAADSLKAAAAKKIAEIKAQHQRNYEYIGLGVIVLLTGFTFLLTRKNKLLDKEKKRSDNLLLNILPEEVAGQLKDTGKSAAKQFDNVTVLFTDFVNFTEAGERMSPQALIDELHICFKAFDDITTKYRVEKIKTIGDAYLAVAGLPTADPQHADHIVLAAIDINVFMQDRLAKLGNRTFDIRIGIHSGSVVAGIVGIKKFAYDIWGDTVNTAARMEQNSEPGKINISETTYELVKDKFDCEYRGEIEAKGKGQLKMYFAS